MAPGAAVFLLCCVASRIGSVHSFVQPASFFPLRSKYIDMPSPVEYVDRFGSSIHTGPLLAMAEDEEVEFVKSDDGDALQALFSKFCNEDGLMTKEEVRSVPVIAELLTDGDLLPEELEDIWRAAPKFPDVDDKMERVDVDSFVQIYRDIDDIFEDDEKEAESVPAKSDEESAVEKLAVKDNDAGVTDDVVETDEDETTAGDEKELEIVFQSICDEAGLVSLDALRKWDEVADLISEGMLGEDEFDRIWGQTPRSPGSPEELDLDGFLSFNLDLDDLFVFDDQEEDDKDASDDIESSGDGPVLQKRSMVVGDDLPPGVIFAELADDDFLVGFDDLKRWGELQEMLDGGDLLPLELQNMFEQVKTAPGTSDKLNEDDFIALYENIDAMFEEDDDEDDAGSIEPASSLPEQASVKSDLLSFVAEMNSDEERLPCGLESTDREQTLVLNMVSVLESQPSNVVQQRGGKLEQADLTGEWELLYSSSSAMKFNKGLSGLGGSFPNGKFGGLKQKLEASKFMSDVEYVERIDIPAGQSFDVTVNGDWSLRGSINIFSGDPTTVLNVAPERVEYGFTSTRADHWKSVGPLNVLDITYLDDDLRIMRGNTSTDTVFVFKRC
eukprot:CAMPEP_0113547204 /NCGR_PEP_ID=MMETSP0015_2-20120614/12227_1 /TAXON_ID=2838 /ORGANISM="Odontella" /LENGTH=612 /DNA_ID=CAMNT_0000447735 /DNA_START=294 /DNA_END=2132 /DNA_ORIENTATION=+ /assembly_acc=CAM_ASM_000160